MKPALQVESGADDQLIFAQQLGVEQVFVETTAWGVQALKALVNRVNRAGMRLAGCEGLEGSGAAHREPEIDDICRIIADAGKAGIPQVNLAWSREDRAESILRAAEEAGVRVAWRFVSDKPGEPGRSARNPGKQWGLDISLEACGSTGEALEAVRTGGDRIFSVLLANRADAGTRPCPLDEGVIEIPVVLRALADIGFSGPVRAARGPEMAGDTAWGHKRRAFDLGYLRAVLQTLASGDHRTRGGGGDAQKGA